MSWLSGLAAAGVVPVFPAIGENALAAAEDLALDPRIEFVSTPRRAAILLVIGATSEDNLSELHRLHDQLPHPRATVWWKTEPPHGFAGAVRVAEGEDAATRITETFRALLGGGRSSEPDILPDEPPSPWRGRGDHGQGGKGMMGGTPYGRPMAMTAEDIRDGLTLDAYSAPFGPFLPMLPPGMVLDLTLQGDVIQKAAMRQKPFPQTAGSEREEMLRRIARTLRLLGLRAQAERFFRAARAVAMGETVDLARLHRIIRWSGVLRAIPEGLGGFGPSPTDARMRLARWLDRAAGTGAEMDTAGPLPDEDIDRLLSGLEWQEAMLVVNSIGIEALRRFPEAEEQEEESRAGQHEHQDEQHQNQHHGHDHGHHHHGGGHA